MPDYEARRGFAETEGDGGRAAAQGVAHAALFGSLARGDERRESDIDIMVEIAPEARVGLFDYVGIVEYIEEMFPVRVDVANREGLKSYVRPSAERDAIYAF